MSSVVIQTAFLGDMILTTPLFDRLAQRGRVSVVATPASAGLLANHPSVHEVIVYDKRGADSGLGGLRRLASRVAATGAQAAYLAQGSLRTAAVARLAGVPVRIGFDSSPGRVLYTERVRFNRDQHHAQRLWSLASSPAERTHAGGLPTPRPTLFPGAAERTAVDELLSAHGALALPLIALAPGSVWATKRWPSYDALARQLAEQAPDARVVVIGGKDDAALARGISDALVAAGAREAIDATGKLSLLASAELIARARVLVTNDSAPLHLASAMNTPTVALFGPTVTAFGFGPLADARAIAEVQQLACRPCDAHGPRTCPLGHWRCMRELSVDVVAGMVERIG